MNGVPEAKCWSINSFRVCIQAFWERYVSLTIEFFNSFCVILNIIAKQSTNYLGFQNEKRNISKLRFRFGKNLIFPYIPKSRKEFLDHVNICVVNFKIHQNFGKFMLHNLKSDDNLCQFLNSKLFSHPRKFYKKRVKFL